MQAITMTAIVAEHQRQVQELTQQIGELCQQINARDAEIAILRTALDAAVETLQGIRAAPKAIQFVNLNDVIRVCLFARNTNHG